MTWAQATRRPRVYSERRDEHERATDKGPRWPSREELVRITTEVAEASGYSFSDLMGLYSSRCVREARRQAWACILAETGCSILGLSEVWGTDRRNIQRSLDVLPEFRGRDPGQMRLLSSVKIRSAS